MTPSLEILNGYIFHFKIFEDTSPFCWATDTPFEPLVMSAPDFNARVNPSRVLCHVCVQWILRFTSGVTPADLLI